MTAETAVCVAGWHYRKDFYTQVRRLPHSRIFVVSHQPRHRLPAWLAELVAPERIWCERNIGYDWGCYQQFLAKGVWRQFEYVAFIHDDVLIKDPLLLEKCCAMLQEGHAVIGNGRVAARQDWPRTHAECYAHACWRPPSRDVVHDLVRGSFFFTTRHALQRLGHFEVFWDPWHVTSGFGNWSTRATCGKWEALLGERCFGFLSEQYCDSPYLTELVRGGLGEEARVIRSPMKRRIVHLIREVSRRRMAMHWGEPIGASQTLAVACTRPLMIAMSGVTR